MNKYEVLETCLKELENGADVETVLSRRPELADELRPILETALKARAIAAPPPSEAALRRNRARVLQRAAELRERKAIPIIPPLRRNWSASLRRVFVTLATLTLLFAGGNGLVRASSTTLPGDNLYPVKRTWEELAHFFVFDPQRREALELEHANERLEELAELLARGRTAKVDFSGYVTRQAGTEWLVSGIPVFLSADTRLIGEPIAVGAAVRVRGQTQGAGVLAERIELLPPGTRLPEVNEDVEQEEDKEAEEQIKPTPTPTSKVDAPTPAPTLTPTPTITATPAEASIEGVVTSIQNKLIVVNGIVLDTQFAEEIKGTPAVGAFAKAKGYYDAGGIFIVKKIEFIPPASISAPTPTPRSNDSDSNVNTNTNDNANDNKNDNHNDNHNDNDND
ncbi:MAG: hypothetical protein Kow0070_18820 [Anaerolineales bacterium]